MTGRRLSFSGNAVPTTLVGGITNSAMSFSVAAISGWPNTAIGPFVLVLDRGDPTLEEKILVSAYSGTSVTVLQRGYDNTTPQAHGNGAPVVHTWDATTADQANDVVNGVGSVAPHASAIGDSASNGTSKYPAAADHVHAREQFATGATAASAPGDTEFDGTSTSPARADHRHAREAAAEVETPIGGGMLWFSNSIPTNWLALHGQTITGGATTYSQLAAAYPSWVSGADLVLPDTRDRFPVGAGTTYTVGQTGGSANVSLTTGHIPQFSGVSVTLSGLAHSHGGSTASGNATHSHTPNSPYEFVVGLVTSDGYDLVTPSGSAHVSFDPVGTSTANAPHTHGINSDSISGASGSVTFGNATPTPVPTVPPYFAVNFIVKAA